MATSSAGGRRKATSISLAADGAAWGTRQSDAAGSDDHHPDPPARASSGRREPALTRPGARRLRVAYLVTSGGIGGAELQVRSLALKLTQRGWDAGVITMLPLTEPFVGLGEDGVWTASLGMRRRVADPRALVGLRTLLRAREPDVLHSHMVHANLLARISRMLVRTPVVISTMHNQNEGAQWRYAAYRLTRRLSDETTAVSRGAVEEAVRRGAAREGEIKFMPNGIEVSQYAPDAAVRQGTRRNLRVEDKFVWLAVGRLVEAKGYSDMIAAFRIAHDRYPESTLLIAGAGPLEPIVRRLIVDAELTSAVTLLGLRTDVPALMQAADAFVMSSLWEGLPLVLLEAAASALPIVATDVGGSRDVIVDGVTGHLAPPRIPDALAEAMCLTMSLPPEERSAMGAAGRRVVSRSFDIEAVADAWEHLYLRLLGASRTHVRGAVAGM